MQVDTLDGADTLDNPGDIIDQVIEQAEDEEALAEEEAGLEAGFDDESAGKQTSTALPGADDADGADDNPPGNTATGDDKPEDRTPAPPPPTETTTLESRIRKLEGQLGNVVQKNKALEEQLRARPPAPSGPPIDIDQVLAQDAEFVAFQREFPEWGAAMKKAVGVALKSAQMAPGGAAVITPELRQQIAREAVQAVSLKQLQARYADFEDHVKNPDLQAWVATQGEDVRAKWQSDWGSDVADVIDAYVEARRGGVDGGGDPGTESPPSPTQRSEAPTERRTGSRLQRGLPSTTSRAAPPRVVPSEDEAFMEGFRTG